MIPAILLGAAAGLLIGSLFDDGGEDEHQELDLELTYRDDEDGRHHVIKPGFEVSEHTRFALLVVDPPHDVAIHPNFTDSDGELFIPTTAIGPAGEGYCFVPWGALDALGGARVVPAIATFEGDDFVGVTRFDEVIWPSRGSYSNPRHWRPLIELARAVAEPFGDECLRSADTAVRDWIEAEPHEDAAFRIVWRSSRSAEVGQSVNELFLRFPYIDEVDVFTHLAGLIPAGTSIRTPVMLRIADAMGLPKNDWPEDPRGSATVVPGNGPKQGSSEALGAGVDEFTAACVRLSVSVGASLEEVRSAYRSLIKGYHPDRVASLPAEFQELAKVKSQEINAAHRIVLHHLRNRSAA